MKQTFILMLVLALPGMVKAQGDFKVSTADGKRIVTGSQTYSKPDREIFANALLWVIDRGSQLKEALTDCDYDKLRLTMAYSMKAKEDATTFTAQLQIQVSQGRLVYLVSDIKGLPNGMGAVFGATSFDRMNPDKKPKQKAMVDEFEAENKKQLQGLLKFVGETSTSIQNWNDIVQGQVKKGMSLSDVKLILGKPVDTQVSGASTQLMFSQFVYVFMEDERVTSVMQ